MHKKKTLKEKELDLLRESEEWESGERGAKNRRVPRVKEEKIDERSGLQMISIRLPSELVRRIKLAAKDEGMKYQPFLRHLLFRLFSEEPQFVPFGSEIINRMERLEKEVAQLKRKK